MKHRARITADGVIPQNSPVFQGCEMEYVPIFLGGLMKMCGNTPPLYIKSRFTTRVMQNTIHASRQE